MDELAELAASSRPARSSSGSCSGAQSFDPQTLMGSGKLQDLIIHALRLQADFIVVDQNLTPAQARAIAEATDLKVIDRSQLILDIFARRARTREGKIQVELAQLKYLLPRLMSRGDSGLSRLEGGIGGRGPGEQKLEIDRRRVRDRIRAPGEACCRRSASAASSAAPAGASGTCRSSRWSATRTPARARCSTCSPAARSSSSSRMFATLDPTSRRLRLPREREVVINDTVGFIRDLPPDLLAAFRATLEEIEDSDLIVHLVDASHPGLRAPDRGGGADPRASWGTGRSRDCWSSTRSTCWARTISRSGWPRRDASPSPPREARGSGRCSSGSMTSCPRACAWAAARPEPDAEPRNPACRRTPRNPLRTLRICPLPANGPPKETYLDHKGLLDLASLRCRMGPWPRPIGSKPMNIPRLQIDVDSEVPVYRQIADGVRSAALDGRLRPGDRLPADARPGAAARGQPQHGGRRLRGLWPRRAGSAATRARAPSWSPARAAGADSGEPGAEQRRLVHRVLPQPSRGPSAAAAIDLPAGPGPGRHLLRRLLPGGGADPGRAVRHARWTSRCARAAPSVLAYGPTAGHPPLRETIAAEMRARGCARRGRADSWSPTARSRRSNWSSAPSSSAATRWSSRSRPTPAR